MTETWKDALDKGYKVGVIFVDFKKAFDTINHEILKFKLQAAGLSGDVHNWLVNYLSNRQQYLDINGTHSTLRIVEIGVPQGSLLGPRLFAIYVNDLPDATPLGYIHMLADDTTIFYIGKDIEQIIDTLNSILKDLYAWCSSNKMTVHTGKTEGMIISSSPFVGPLRPLYFGNSVISFTTKSTALGFTIYNELSWKPQVEAMCKTFLSKLKFLKRLKRLPSHVLEEIYFKRIISSVTYCIGVWGTCSVPLFNDIEKLHIRAAQLIHRIPETTVDHEVLRIANWKPVSYIYKRRLATIMHQVYYNNTPDLVKDLFAKRTSGRNLRTTECFELKQSRTEYGRVSVKFRGPQIWNSLSKSLKSTAISQSFKNKLKREARTLENIQFKKAASVVIAKDPIYIYF